MNSGSENNIEINNGKIIVSFNSITKEFNIGNTYENFLKNFQESFNINDNYIKRIIFRIEDNQIDITFGNNEIYNEIFGENGILKNYINHRICKAVLIDDDIEKKCIFLEEEIRKNKNTIQVLNDEINDLLNQKRKIKEYNENNKYFENEKKESPPKNENEIKTKLSINKNVAIEKLNNIQYKKPIIYVIKIKKKESENWPNNLKIICVPNDSDIFFKYVDFQLNKEKPKEYINGKYIYEKEIKIIFKNYRTIKKKEYFLHAILICDNNGSKFDIGNIIVRIV